MPWFKVDDAFTNNPKVVGLSMAARGLWLSCGTYCARFLTDGHIARKQIRREGGTATQVDQLIDSGLWKVCESHTNCVRFHDWNRYQITHASATKKRDDQNRRQRESRSTKAADQQEPQNVTRDIERDRGRDGPRDGERDPLIPVTNTYSIQLGGESYVGRTPASTDPPPRFCDQHPGGTDEPCGACGTARRRAELADRLAAAAADDAAVRARDAARAAVADCPLCDDAGWLLGDGGVPVEPVVRCRHRHLEAVSGG